MTAQPRGRKMKAFLRFLWKHWAALLITICALLASWTGYQMWQAKMPKAMLSLPRLLLYLGLIVVVVLVRYALVPFAKRMFEKGKASLKRQVTQEVVEQGKTRASDTLEKGIEGAKGVFASASEEVRQEWEELTGKRKTPVVSMPQGLTHCPVCGRAVRPSARFCDGCGAALVVVTCPKCGRKLRPGSKFCDGCGASIGPG